VSFDITNEDNNIDISTLNVYFSETDFGAPAIYGGEIQDGYNVNISEIVDGYSVVIVPSSYHRGTSIAVKIEIDTLPSSGLATFTSRFSTADHVGYVQSSLLPIVGTDVSSFVTDYNGFTFSGRAFNVIFQLNDASSPIITSRVPVANSTGNSRSTTIVFYLHDRNQEGVDINSLDVYINNEQVISESLFIPFYTGSISDTTIDGFDGFRVEIIPPDIFSYGEGVDVRVVVEDLVDDPAAVNVLDTTYSFTIEQYIDVEGPSIELVLPDTGLGLGDCIEFDWLDAPFGDGPDLNTLNVTLRRELQSECITAIRDSIAVVDGIAAPGYTLYTSYIEVGDQKGYHITICPDIPFNELETIKVIINGEDSQGNSGENTFEISTLEETPPEILNISPEAGSTVTDHSESIVFEMHDFAGTGVNVSALIVKIDDGEAVIDGVAQSGYSFSYENVTVTDQFSRLYDGYHFEIARDIPFTPGREIAVEIDGYDGYGNLATEVFAFTIAPDTTPPTISFYPENGTVDVVRDTFITVQIRDALGVDRSSINISVNGSVAVASGQGVVPFDVYISETELTPGVPDGYSFIIDTEEDFLFNQNVYITADAADIFGNSISEVSVFRTYNETVPPSFTGICPRDGQREVSLKPDIEVIIRDGYDVDLYRTNISVNGDPAVIDGVAHPGYSLDTIRIDGSTPGVDPGDGYYLVIHPQKSFGYNETVEVAFMAFDRSQGNRAYETVSWHTINPSPPKYDVTPYSNQEDVNVDTNIHFEVFADGYNLNINSLGMSIDGNTVIENGVVQAPDYTGTITEIDGYQYYTGVINPRFLLDPNTVHTLSIGAREDLSENFSQLSYTFNTASAPNNPKTVYVGDENGVKSILVDDVDGPSSTSTVLDGYFVNGIYAKELAHINRVLVGTRDSGAVLVATNYSVDSMVYSVGDEIDNVYIASTHNGTIYLLNRTRSRVDVYYDILYDDVGRSIPDVYYGIDGYALQGILDGYFTDMVVTEETSTVNSNSNSIFIGTSDGVFRIETDESVPGQTEINGSIISYGISGSGADYEVLDGTTNYIVSIDVNTRLNYLYVATRSEDSNDENAVSYINLDTNSFDGSVTESRLIHRLINDISFNDPE
jgi:hypothetical protein